MDSSAIISAMYSFLYDKPKGGLAEVLTCYPQVRKIEEETDSKKPKFEIMNRYFLMFQESTPNKDKQKILQGKQFPQTVYVHRKFFREIKFCYLFREKMAKMGG